MTQHKLFFKLRSNWGQTITFSPIGTLAQVTLVRRLESDHKKGLEIPMAPAMEAGCANRRLKAIR